MFFSFITINNRAVAPTLEEHVIQICQSRDSNTLFKIIHTH